MGKHFAKSALSLDSESSCFLVIQLIPVVSVQTKCQTVPYEIIVNLIPVIINSVILYINMTCNAFIILPHDQHS